MTTPELPTAPPVRVPPPAPSRWFEGVVRTVIVLLFAAVAYVADLTLPWMVAVGVLSTLLAEVVLRAASRRSRP